MAERKNESFTVTDRRLFTSDGELRKDVPEEKETPALSKPSSTEASAVPEANEPPPPSTDEQNEQARAYEKSSAEMDRQAELSGISTKEMEITFERFLASLYMTGMLQLGLMHQQGAPPQLELLVFDASGAPTRHVRAAPEIVARAVSRRLRDEGRKAVPLVGSVAAQEWPEGVAVAAT